jgi:hypothetical protein
LEIHFLFLFCCFWPAGSGMINSNTNVPVKVKDQLYVDWHAPFPCAAQCVNIVLLGPQRRTLYARFISTTCR